MPSQPAPEGLQERGVALWSALGQDVATPSGQLALEACRAADRLEDLDRVVRGEGVLELLTFRLQHVFNDEDGDRNVSVKVEFSNVLAEARQQQSNFKALLAELGVKAGAAPSRPVAAPASNPLDELNRKRQAKAK